MSGKDLRILANLIEAKAASDPSRDILTFVDIAPDGSFREEIRTYADLWDNGRKLALVLERHGVAAKDRFALVMQNHPEFVEAMVAASILGAVFVPVDPRTMGDKLRHMLDFAQCKGAIVADYAFANLREILPNLPHLKWIAVFGSDARDIAADVPLAFALEAEMPATAPTIPVRSQDAAAPMQMLFTSGTTGDPKAIVTSHERFASSAIMAPILGLTEDDRPYTGLSLTHANAQLITLGMALHNGMRAVFSRRFTKSRLWDVTRRYGCTVFNLLGGMTVALYSEPERANDSENPVRIVLSAGMPANLWERFARRFGVDIFEFYGTAEGGLTFNRPGTGPIGSVGKPPPVMEVAILDSNSNPVAPGMPGEICFRSAGVQSPNVQYYRNAEASEKKMAGGWLHTGDIGHLDEDGWLFFHHRMGDEIRRNGDFINPGFIEKALAEHPQVSDVTVYGIPAASGAPGESDVVAAIVPADPDTLDVASVFAHCRRKLEPNMIPAYLQIVDEIPKTASEKPMHRLLQNSFSAASDNVFRSANANTRVNAMTRKANIVVYGASGYTGQIIMERLAALGLPFVAAGRDRSRLQAAVAKLPALCRGFAEIAAVRHTKEDMAKLFEGAQIVINVTGPFGQIGKPVLEAALAARCHYLDTTGETDWIMTVRDQFGAQFAKAGRIACPALAYMWTAGQLACELALEHGDIDSLDIVYGPGSAPTIASTLSFLRMVTKPQYRLVNNAMDAWPPDARVSVTLPHMHEIMPGLPWGGGAEPIWYAQDPRVRNCRVVVALQSGPMVDWILDCARRYQEAAHTKSLAELEELTNEWGRAIASTPPREDVAVNRNVISCKARGAFAGREITLYGSAPYEQTGTLMAEGARQLLSQKVTAGGFVSPAAAFGARKLLGALAKAGLQQSVSAPLKNNGAKAVSRRIVAGHAKRRAPVAEKHMKAAH